MLFRSIFILFLLLITGVSAVEGDEDRRSCPKGSKCCGCHSKGTKFCDGFGASSGETDSSQTSSSSNQQASANPKMANDTQSIPQPPQDRTNPLTSATPPIGKGAHPGQQDGPLQDITNPLGLVTPQINKPIQVIESTPAATKSEVSEALPEKFANTVKSYSDHSSYKPNVFGAIDEMPRKHDTEFKAPSTTGSKPGHDPEAVKQGDPLLEQNLPVEEPYLGTLQKKKKYTIGDNDREDGRNEADEEEEEDDEDKEDEEDEDKDKTKLPKLKIKPKKVGYLTLNYK